MTEERHGLIDQYLSRTISEDEFSRLQDLLREDAEARSGLRSLATIDAKLQDLAAGNSMPAPQWVTAHVEPAPLAVGGRRRIIAISALVGIAVGFICASSVYALILPRVVIAPDGEIDLLREGFDGPDLRLVPGFPRQLNQWGASDARVVTREEGVEPKSGHRMAKLFRGEPGTFGEMYYVFDLSRYPALRRDGSREIQISAAFQVARPREPGGFNLRAATFAQGLDEVDPRWMSDGWIEVGDHSLDHAARGTRLDPGNHNWCILMLSISAPRNAQYIVVRCTANQSAGIAHPGVYVDDLRIALEPSATR